MTISRSFRAAFVAALVASSAAVVHAQQTVQTWLLLNPTSQETFFVTDPAEQARLTQAGWKVNGTGGLLSAALPQTTSMQRLVKGTAEGVDRIFAISPEQSAAAIKAGYTLEGALGFVAPTRILPNLLPVYHFTKGARNLWLMNKADLAWAAKNGWKSTGPAFWIWPKSGN